MFKVGDKIKNIHTGETGKVIKVEYVDGKVVYETDIKPLDRFNSKFVHNYEKVTK